MLTKYTTHVFLIFSSSIVFQSMALANNYLLNEVEVERLQRAANETGKIKINRCQDNSYTPPKKICPSVLVNELLDTKDGGLVGFINIIDQKLTGETDLSSPYQTCNDSNYVQNSIPLRLKLKSKFPEFDYDCDTELDKRNYSKKDKQKAFDYMYSLALDKSEKIENNIFSLLQAKSQIDILLGKKSKYNCYKIDNQKYSDICENFKACKISSRQPFENEVDRLFETLNQIKSIRRGYNTKSSTEKEELDKLTTSILDAHPILHSKALNNLRFLGGRVTLTRDKVKIALESDLKDARDRTDEKLNDMTQAYSCLKGKAINCSDLREISREDYSQLPSSVKYSARYECIESIKNARDTANKDLNDVAISTALGFTPLGITMIGKALVNGSKIAEKIIASEEISRLALKVGFHLDTANALYEFKKLKDACEKKLKFLDQMENTYSCQSELKRMENRVDIEQCTKQAIMTTINSISPITGIIPFFVAKNIKAPQILTMMTDTQNSHFAKELENHFLIYSDELTRNKKIMELENKLTEIRKIAPEITDDNLKVLIRFFINQCKK